MIFGDVPKYRDLRCWRAAGTGRCGVAPIRWRDRFRYWFDNTMSRGTPALIGWLGLVYTGLDPFLCW